VCSIVLHLWWFTINSIIVAQQIFFSPYRAVLSFVYWFDRFYSITLTLQALYNCISSRISYFLLYFPPNNSSKHLFFPFSWFRMHKIHWIAVVIIIIIPMIVEKNASNCNCVETSLKIYDRNSFSIALFPSSCCLPVFQWVMAKSRIQMSF